MTRYVNRRTRRGAAILVAIVLLVVVVTIMGIVLRQVATSQRMTRQQSWELQAQLLAESAIDRALVQLERNQEYRGETWLPLVGAAPADERGEALIKLTKRPDSDSYELVVTATFPNHPAHRALVMSQRIVPQPVPTK
ncbi:hypothetical protein ETAA8_49740 [Anatilimnocola aggregata]|uniref:Uncharacterized protein n=1 Tax=Anatilimnocola aggregata TaxID=2528021 RepID=A0A517YI10_9BACT|nr:hypothetical protein [Anatilimnocola aggregata]QDU29858.1 hypothetical protein ETAA8_49740 [Anatilimnocola aggregata]